MRRGSLLTLLPLFLLAGCETRLSHLKAVNDYRVEAPKLRNLKAQRNRLIANIEEARHKPKAPMFLFHFSRPSQPEAEAIARRQLEDLRRRALDNANLHLEDVERRIAEIEPIVEALRARLGEHADDYLRKDYEE